MKAKVEERKKMLLSDEDKWLGWREVGIFQSQALFGSKCFQTRIICSLFMLILGIFYRKKIDQKSLETLNWRSARRLLTLIRN